MTDAEWEQELAEARQVVREGLNARLRHNRHWYDLFIPTPVPWQPAAPKPTLGAAITRLLEKS